MIRPPTAEDVGSVEMKAANGRIGYAGAPAYRCFVAERLDNVADRLKCDCEIEDDAAISSSHLTGTRSDRTCKA